METPNTPIKISGFFTTHPSLDTQLPFLLDTETPAPISDHDIHRLLSRATNILYAEASATGTQTLDAIISTIENAASGIAGIHDINTGTHYIIQIVEPEGEPVTARELKALQRLCSKFPQGSSIVWSLVRLPSSTSLTLKLAAANLRPNLPLN